ncbi:hypothetical protein [Streptomyces omiyaensis]|uniref:Integral membrane protein n=1 Tax=Streptomyces omiyaensis TaxID=68247 RepID=A0ABW7BYG1_9ACTN
MSTDRPSGSGENRTVVDLMLAEYQAIKEEQRARIGFRDNLLYVTLAAVTAVIAAAAQTRSATLLLALPPVCVVLGWTYVVNDEKISAIGGYVRSTLRPGLAARVDGATGAPELFGWETAHRSDSRRTSRKKLQCLVDVATFCLVPLGGLTFFWSKEGNGKALLALSWIEAATVLGLAVQILLYAGFLGSSGPRPAAVPLGEGREAS